MAMSTCRNGKLSEELDQRENVQPDLLSQPSLTYVSKEQIQEIVKERGRRQIFWGVFLNTSLEVTKIEQGKYELGCQYKHVQEDPVGRGVFSEVYLCEDVSTKCKFVEKITKIKHYSLVEREVRALTSFDFQHIVKLLGMITNEKHVHLFLEYGGTSLHRYFNLTFCRNGVPVPPEMKLKIIKYIFRQVLEACIELHTKNRVHCDLHQGNILANENGLIKFCDLSSLKSTQDKLRIYTPWILPPTVLRSYLKKESQKQQVVLYREQHGLTQEQVSLAKRKRALSKDAKDLEEKQICLLKRQSKLLEEKTRLQAETNQLLQQDEEISYQYARSKLEKFQQQQNTLGRELDDIEREQTQLFNQERQLHQLQMDISASQENCQKQQAILRQKSTYLLKQQVENHEKAKNCAKQKLETFTVSPRLDTYAVGKLMLEKLVGSEITIEELEPHMYNETAWENFVKRKIPETFWNLDQSLCELIQDLMSFTTKIDAETALHRCK